MQNEAMGVFIYVICLLGFIGFVLLLKRALLRFVRFTWKAALGVAAILAANTYLGGMGFSVALNPVTVLVSALFGLPGVGAMLILGAW